MQALPLPFSPTPDSFTYSPSYQLPSPDTRWPAPPGPLAFRGLAGRIVQAVEPYSEADPVAVLAQLLVAVGNAAGNDAFMAVGATRHHPREFLALVGSTGVARKGDSWQPVYRLMERADPDWAMRIVGGLSSGEGLIGAVRDATKKTKPISGKNGRIDGYQEVLEEAGIDDKRLLVMEGELARPLAAMMREGNTLSSVIRAAWDTGDLFILTKTPVRATGAHISILAHITHPELRKEMPDTAATNGFANRFLWVLVRRSKLLPDPPVFDGPIVEHFADEIKRVLHHACGVGLMERDTQASQLWKDIYGPLTEEQEGLLGSLTARAAPHVLRLSMIYALLDCSGYIQVEHLEAALTLWDYVERCLEYIFGNATGDPVADKILRALQKAGELSRTHISRELKHHVPGARIERSLDALSQQGLIVRAIRQPVSGSGRPAELYRLADAS
jgi:hypothetical protein